VRIVGERNGSTFDVQPERVRIDSLDWRAGVTNDLPGEAFQLLTPEVAYLKLSSVSAAQSSDYISKAAGTKVLVVDIRNYPREFVVFALGGHFVSRPTEFVRFTRGSATNPGAFVWTPPISLRPLAPLYDGKIVILVDETSQSQAEYTAMAFRSAPNALVVGSTTAGADGNISPIVLPGGLSTLISGIGVFYPDRRPTQQVGIVPDLVVRPTIAGIRQGRDEVLEAAVSRALGRTFTLPRRN
jgi:C-terminal processing protease CtpA/Prc